jgi:hypothetical protein
MSLESLDICSFEGKQKLLSSRFKVRLGKLRHIKYTQNIVYVAVHLLD